MNDTRPQLAPPTVQPQGCGICHGSIDEAEPIMTCPACGLVNHADCWQENLGCGTYGCQQVNILSAVRTSTSAQTPPPLPTSSSVDPPMHPPQQAMMPAAMLTQLPWEHVLLGASAFMALLSLALHGWPSLPAWLAIRVYGELHLQSPGRGLLWAAEAVSVSGFVLGQLLSF